MTPRTALAIVAALFCIGQLFAGEQAVLDSVPAATSSPEATVDPGPPTPVDAPHASGPVASGTTAGVSMVAVPLVVAVLLAVGLVAAGVITARQERDDARRLAHLRLRAEIARHEGET